MGDPDPSLTPEKKLLNIIEGKEAKEAAGEKPAAKGFSVQQLLSPGALKGRLAFGTEQFRKLLKGSGEGFSLRQVVLVLKAGVAVLAVVLIGMLIFDAAMVNQDFQSQFDTSQKERTALPLSQTHLVSPALFQDSLERNMFIPYEKRMEEKKGEAGGTSLQLVEITKDLKLTGISINPDRPEKTYCMIEDLKKDVTSFLKVGDSIAGLTVDEIKPEGVVLKRQGDKVDLR